MTEKQGFLATTELAGDAQPRNSIGGSATVPCGVVIPRCSNCGDNLLLFLQFEIDENWETALKVDSRFVLFICPQCNDIPHFGESFQGRLPVEYWTQTEGNYFAAVFTRSANECSIPDPGVLKTKQLSFKRTLTEDGDACGLRVGAVPLWLQDPESFVCCCGADMEFFLQVSENSGFEKLPDAPSQPNSFSAEDYCLFLGNEIYVFVCPRQCNPQSVWISVQN